MDVQIQYLSELNLLPMTWAVTGVTVPTARWRVADTSAAKFWQEVPIDVVLSPATESFKRGL